MGLSLLLTLMTNNSSAGIKKSAFLIFHHWILGMAGKMRSRNLVFTLSLTSVCPGQPRLHSILSLSPKLTVHRNRRRRRLRSKFGGGILRCVEGGRQLQQRNWTRRGEERRCLRCCTCVFVNSQQERVYGAPGVRHPPEMKGCPSDTMTLSRTGNSVWQWHVVF